MIVLEEPEVINTNKESKRVIYTVTTISGDPNNKEDDRLRSRCWGYYFNRVDAEQCIENNHFDIAELGYYQYAVLSVLEEGPISFGDELQWYEFYRDDMGSGDAFFNARKIEKPQIYTQHIFGTLE